MSECIGYCEKKVGPVYQHPEYSEDKLCGECLISYWEDDFDRFIGEMVASIGETGLSSDLLKDLKDKGFVA